MKRYGELNTPEKSYSSERSGNTPGSDSTKYQRHILKYEEILQGKDELIKKQQVLIESLKRGSPDKMNSSFPSQDISERLIKTRERLEQKDEEIGILRGKLNESYKDLMNATTRAQTAEERLRRLTSAQGLSTPSKRESTNLSVVERRNTPEVYKVSQYSQTLDEEKKIVLLEAKNTKYQEQLEALERLLKGKEESILQMKAALEFEKSKEEELEKELVQINTRLVEEQTNAKESQEYHTSKLRSVTEANVQEVEELRQHYEEIISSLNAGLEALRTEAISRESKYSAVLDNNTKFQSENEVLQEEIASIRKLKDAEHEDFEHRLQSMKVINEEILEELQQYKEKAEINSMELIDLKQKSEEKDIHHETEIRKLKENYEKDKQDFQLALEERAQILTRGLKMQDGKLEKFNDSASPIEERASRPRTLPYENIGQTSFKKLDTLSLSISKASKDPAQIHSENINYTIQILNNEKKMLEESEEKAKIDCEKFQTLCFEQEKKINEISDSQKHLEGEKKVLEQLTGELKEIVSKLDEKFQAQEENIAAYRNRIMELEGHIRELSRQLEKWAISAYGKQLIAPAVENSFSLGGSPGNKSMRSMHYGSPISKASPHGFSQIH